MMCSGVFLTSFAVFRNVFKHCLECLMLSSQSKPKFERKGRKRIVQNYANQDDISKHRLSCFPLFNLMSLKCY